MARPPQLLFISSTYIGDALMSSGALDLCIRELGAPEVTIACGAGPAPLFRAVPGLKAVHVVRKRRYAAHWAALWAKLWRRRFDLAVDMRGTGLTYLLAARRRIVFRKSPAPGHKLDEIGRLFGRHEPLLPVVWLDAQAREEAERFCPATERMLILGPGANYTGKRWPPERFAALAAALCRPGGRLDGAVTLVLHGDADRDHALGIVTAIEGQGLRAKLTSLHLLTVAALMERAALYVGNDSGLLHIAAATGAPTIGLYGPSPEHIYGPRAPLSRILRGPRPYDEVLAAFLRGEPGLMDHISVELALETASELLDAAALGAGTLSA